MMTKETSRRVKRPIAGHLQLETMTDAYKEVQHQAVTLPVRTVEERHFAEGYAQALRDFARETGERQDSLRRRQRAAS